MGRVPARVLRAAEYFRAKYDLPAPCTVYADYVNYHDALHQFIGAPPTSDGELFAFAAERLIVHGEYDNSYPTLRAFNRKYAHLFARMREVA